MEMQLADILDWPHVAMHLHDRFDLLLAGVGADGVEFHFEHGRRRFNANLRRAGEIAVYRIFIDLRHLGDRLAKLGPDVALGVEQADEHFLVDDAMVGMQIAAGGQEYPVGANLPQGVGEGSFAMPSPPRWRSHNR